MVLTGFERGELENICKTNSITVTVPSVPNDTRWFGKQLYMMEAFLKSERGFKIHNMESDWKNGKGFIEVMKPFETVTKI